MKTEKVFRKTARRPLDYITLFSMLIFDIGFFVLRLFQGAHLSVLIVTPILIALQIFMILVLLPGQLEFAYRDAMWPYFAVFALPPVAYLIFGLTFHTPLVGLFYVAAFLRAILYSLFLVLSKYEKVAKSILAVVMCFCIVCSVALSVNTVQMLFDPEINFQLKWPLKRTLEYTYDAKTATFIVTGAYKGLSGRIEVSETYNGKPISAIAKDAFKGDDSITEIVIYADCEIGEGAFSDCINLKSVTINSVTSLNSRVFYGTKSLTQIKITSSSMGNISIDAFEGLNNTVQIATTADNIDALRQALAESEIKDQIVPDIPSNKVYVNFEDSNLYINTIILEQGTVLTGEMLNQAAGFDLFADTVAGKNKDYAHKGQVEGFTLEGWYTSSSFEADKKINIGEYVVNQSISLFPKRLPVYQATLYDGYSSTVFDTILFTKNDTGSLPTISRQGYTFVDWVDSQTEQVVSQIPLGSQTDFSFKAKWTLNAPTLTLSSNRTSNTMEFHANQTMTLSASAKHTLSDVEFSYQWYFDGKILTGKTASTLQIKNVAESGLYKCVATAKHKTFNDTSTVEASITTTITPQKAVLTWGLAGGESFPYQKAEYPVTATLVGSYDGQDVSDWLTFSYMRGVDSVSKAIDAGGYIVYANIQSAMQNYYLEENQNSISFYITPATVSISLKPQTSVYDKTEPDLTVFTDDLFTVTDGTLFEGDVLTLTLSKVLGETVGSYALSAVCTNSNYVTTISDSIFTIAKAQVTLTASNQTAVYSKSKPTLAQDAYTVEGEVFDDDNLNVAISQVGNGVNVGQHDIKVTASNPNYQITTVGAKLTITPSKITLRATNQQAEYLNDEPAVEDSCFEVTSGNYYAGDELYVKIQKAAGKIVGFYQLSMSLTQTNANYEITIADQSTFGKFEIVPKFIVLPLTDFAESYAGKKPSDFDYDVPSSMLDGLIIAGDTVNIKLKIVNEQQIVDVGQYDIAFETDNQNYTIAPITAKFVISPAKISVTLDNQQAEYDGTDLQPSNDTNYHQIHGTIFNNDDVTISLSKPNSATSGLYTVTVSSNNKNYEIDGQTEFENAFEITKKPLEIVFDQPLQDVYKNLGAEAYTLTFNLVNKFPSTFGGTVYLVHDGIVLDDQVVLTVELDTTDSVIQATYSTPYGLKLSIDSPNYEVSTTATYSISPAEISVQLEKQSSIYDGQIPTPSEDSDKYTVTGTIDGDVVEISIAIRNPNSIAGKYDLVASSLDSNYEIEADQDVFEDYFEIEKRQLVLSLPAPASAYYTKSAPSSYDYSLTLTQSNNGGIVAGALGIVDGETVEISISIDSQESFLEVGSYPLKIAVLNPNYTAPSTTNVEYQITPAQITLTVDHQIVVYNGSSFSVTNYDIDKNVSDSKYIAGDDLQVSISMTDPANGNVVSAINAGMYDLTLTANNKNYQIAYSTTIEGSKVQVVFENAFEIKPAEITIHANQLEDIYKGSDFDIADDEFSTMKYSDETGDYVASDPLYVVITKEAGQNVGKYDLTISFSASNPNYIVKNVDLNNQIVFDDYFEIKPIELVYKALPQSSIYDRQPPTVDDSEYEIVSGDILDGETVEVEIVKADGVGAGNYALTIISKNPNYNITTVDSEQAFEIKKAQITITALPQEAFYTKSEPAVDQNRDTAYKITSTSAETGNYIEGDDLNVVITKASGVNVKPDDYLLTVSASNENYEITFEHSRFKIKPALITITAENQTVYLGDSTPQIDQSKFVVTGSLYDSLNELNVRLIMPDDLQVGTSDFITVTAGNPNYAITTVAGTLTVDAGTSPSQSQQAIETMSNQSFFQFVQNFDLDLPRKFEVQI